MKVNSNSVLLVKNGISQNVHSTAFVSTVSPFIDMNDLLSAQKYLNKHWSTAIRAKSFYLHGLVAKLPCKMSYSSKDRIVHCTEQKQTAR